MRGDPQMSPGHLRHAWYAAAGSAELQDRPLAKTVLGEPLALYRQQDGRAAALLDRCPHRFAPLSLGQVDGDSLVCPYHGLGFEADGRCSRVHAQERIPPAAQVRSFPVLERYGLVFVWMGPPELADPAQLVEIPQYGAPGWGLSRGEMLFKARLINILDNLVDPAHTTFVHGRTIGNDAAADIPVSAEDDGQGLVSCSRWVPAAAPVPVVARFARPQGLVDRWQTYRVKLPCTSWVDFGSQDAGLPRDEAAMAQAPYRVLSYAFLTPVSEDQTLYYHFQLRNFAPQDEAVSQEFDRLYEQTFDEDRVLLEAIEREEQRSPGLRPARMASDVGVARLRRLWAQMLERESGA